MFYPGEGNIVILLVVLIVSIGIALLDPRDCHVVLEDQPDRPEPGRGNQLVERTCEKDFQQGMTNRVHSR
jgi:hypothetical protein